MRLLIFHLRGYCGAMRKSCALVLALALATPVVYAQTANGQLQQLTIQAKAENPAFTGFNSQRGQQFFTSTHGNDWSCSSCHTKNPLQTGKHEVTGKIIQPLAPAANASRFSDTAKSEKWFRRNCKDVLKRECTTQEKGDVLSWLLSLK